jgi:hypothetical protein
MITSDVSPYTESYLIKSLSPSDTINNNGTTLKESINANASSNLATANSSLEKLQLKVVKTEIGRNNDVEHESTTSNLCSSIAFFINRRRRSTGSSSSNDLNESLSLAASL